MKIKNLFLSGMALLFAVCVSAVSAGPLEEAQAKLQEGKTAEVDTILGKMLDQRPVSRQALTLSFLAAYTDGRYYTAERRALTLLDAGVPPSSDFLFKAAEIAGKLGKENVQLDRLAHFLSIEKEANPQVATALKILCANGSDASFYDRYVTQFRADFDAFQIGMEQLKRLRETTKSAEYLKMLEIMFNRWKGERELHFLMEEIFLARRANIFGLEPERISQILVKHKISNMAQLYHWGRYDGRWGAVPHADYWLKMQEIMAPSLLTPDMFSSLLNIRDIPEAQRPSFIKRLTALDSIVLSAKDPVYSRLFFVCYTTHHEDFFGGDEPALPPEKSIKLVRDFLSKNAHGNIDFRNRLKNIWAKTKWTEADQRALAVEFPLHIHGDTMKDLFAATYIENKDAAGVNNLLTKAGYQQDVVWAFFDTALKIEDKNLVEALFRRMILGSPLDFYPHHMSRLIGFTKMTVPERVALCEELFNITGYSPSWKRILDDKNLPLKDEPQWKEFLTRVKPDVPAKDPLIGACTQLSSFRRENKVNPKVHEIATKGIAGFKGKYPNPDAPEATHVFARLVDQYRNLVSQSPDDAGKCFDNLLPKYGKNADWMGLGEIAHWSRSPDRKYVAAKAHLSEVGTYEPIWFFNEALEPKDATVALYGNYYAEMDADRAIEYVLGNRERWTQSLYLRELTKVVRQHSLISTTEQKQRDLMDAIIKSCDKPENIAQLPIEEIAVQLFDRWEGKDYFREWTLNALKKTGNIDSLVNRYLAGAATLPPISQQRALAMLLEWSNTPEDNASLLARPTKPEELTSPISAYGVSLTKLSPALKSADASKMLLISQRLLTRWLPEARDISGKPANPDIEKKTAVIEDQAMLALANGASFIKNYYRSGFVAALALSRAIEGKDTRKISDMARAAAICFDRGRNSREYLNVLGEMSKKELWEAVYLLTEQIETKDSDVGPEFARLRAEASAHMPGLYPVSENDPAYPLYLAADELQRRNTERAWTLLRQHIAVLEKDPLRFPPQFVAWAVEQLRRVRGERDTLQAKAKAMIDLMLAKEQQLTPDLAASLMLTRAEIARDRRMLDAARTEYQAIRNHPVYQKTPSGRQAMFREVDLMVAMGNVSGAEQTIETWMSVPDIEVQAQAYYMLARIAFNRSDYEETRAQLEKTFEIDFTHTEARLLHGKWKLATNYEIDDTQVLVGDLADRSLIRPGQPLAITVQDRNLGIVGGGSTIPVVLTTSSGGDREMLQLYPSTRDPFLFRGTINTALAQAKQGNHILEIKGDDIVSYVVDAKFLTDRGLKPSDHKELRVVDDAMMAIGASVLDAEDGKAAAELERELSGETPDSDEKCVLTGNLRPGSPLYIAVRDRDRSISASNNTVIVSVTTSSGDVLDKVILPETRPHSGIFRGALPTHLPMSRASASDSASGINPGAAINKNLTGGWRSVSDGQKGKWFDVDTMGSHLISSATIKMPKPNDISLLKLYGRLSEEEIFLGSFPEQGAGVLGGIQSQRAETHWRKAADVRRHFQTATRTVKQVDDWRVELEGSRYINQALLVSGVIAPATFQTVRFRFAPLWTIEKDLPLNEAWVELVLDGRTIFTGSGRSLGNKIVEVDLPAGPQSLEIVGGGRRQCDAFRLMMEQEDGSIVSLPKDWTDVSKNPELKEFLAFKAQLERTADGFKANFKNPVRLRALKWEFTDFVGSEVAISSVEILDKDGKVLIPVDTDFSQQMNNNLLEVAPGDKIVVTYLDDITSSGEKRVVERSLTSSFHDAEITFMFEELEAQGGMIIQSMHEAHRFQPGDNIYVSVIDPDMDRTPGVDSVTVTVKTESGQTFQVKAQERLNKVTRQVDEGGNFLALLRTVKAGSDPASSPALKGAIPVADNDLLTVTYFDQENTKPGIPIEREARLRAVPNTQPRIQFYHTWNERVQDQSEEAKAQLTQIKRRPGNERIDTIYRDVFWASPMAEADMPADKYIAVNASAPIPISVIAPSRARHTNSMMTVEAFTEEELSAAETEGRYPVGVKIDLKLKQRMDSFRLKIPESQAERISDLADTFFGQLNLRIGKVSTDFAGPKVKEEPELIVKGSDIIRLRFLDEQNKPQIERSLKLVSAAQLDLMDSTYVAERKAVHLGERFYISVLDPDRDISDAQDEIELEVIAEKGGAKRKIVLTETLPNSGHFTGGVRPVFFGTNAIPADLEDQLPVDCGDNVIFRYKDEVTLSHLKPGHIEMRGSVYEGDDGKVRLFSKRFRDADQAVLVQFRLAECLFETAKDFRKLKQFDKSSAAIAEGREILERALRDYPATSHAMQGEYLLANLYQELGEEQKQAGNMEEARSLYQEALARFSSMLATWPDGDYAARAQYHKALCLEMLEDFTRASEEYVKMTYLFPDSPLVGDASIRLATYYYTQEKRYDTAGRIYESFQRRFPTHPRASRSLFMGAQCHMKQAEEFLEQKKANSSAMARDQYKSAVASFTTLVDTYRDSTEKDLLAQSLYWAGDASFKIGDYQNAYIFFKRTVFEYPESEWARRARGVLLQESSAFEDLG